MAIIRSGYGTSERRLITIEDTNFIWRTNFSGDPERDSFGNDARQANIIIPDEGMAKDLADEGFNIKVTKPREGEEEGFTPRYYVSVKINFDSFNPPRIYLVSGDADPLLLDEESVDILDRCEVLNVNATLSPYENPKTGRKSLYVRTMYVEQDIEDDPFAQRYIRKGE